MYKLEIKKQVRLSKTSPKKERYFAYFEDENLAKTMFSSIKENNEIITEKENSIIYIDRKTGKTMNTKLSKCRNADIPQLKENEVWMKLYSHKETYKESMIITFKEKEDYENYITKKALNKKYKSLAMPNQKLIYYMDNLGQTVYATTINKEKELWF